VARYDDAPAASRNNAAGASAFPALGAGAHLIIETSWRIIARQNKNEIAMRGLAGLFFFQLAVLGGVAAPTPSDAREAVTQTSCRTLSKAQVTALFDHWNRALLTKRPDTVVAEYAADATLLPTVQNGPLIGPEALTKYFDYFLKQSPQATIDTRVIHTGCNIAYDIGLYTFLMDGDQPGARKQVKARYTFIYAPVHGKWLIVHHHSSAVPVTSQ
jgi:uncharacterized protein (TIGR02246 family)